MSKNLIRFTRFLILGLVVGCSSSGGGDSSGTVLVVAANEVSATTGNNTNAGGTTGQSSDEGNADSSAGQTTTAETTDGTSADVGMNPTDAGSTDSPDATGGSGPITTGVTDDGGTDTGDTTIQPNSYPPGSLADLLQSQENISVAFAALQDAGIELELNDPGNEWTVFLPSNNALAAQPLFDIEKHIHKFGANTSEFLNDSTTMLLVGDILMDDVVDLIITGDGAGPLTISDADATFIGTVTTADIIGNTSLTVVHVIDIVIVQKAGNVENEYPAGSLASVLANRSDLSIAFDALKSNGLVESLDDPDNPQTLFLPDNSAFARPVFDSDVHIYPNGALGSIGLTGLSGLSLPMKSGDNFVIGGGGTDTLTFGGVNIVETDVQNASMTGTFVHIIDGVLTPSN